jgi:glycine cleavage system regulatory protein
MNDLPKDPFMLLSWVNMKLRDRYESLQALCDDLDIDGSLSL